MYFDYICQTGGNGEEVLKGGTGDEVLERRYWGGGTGRRY